MTDEQPRSEDEQKDGEESKDRFRRLMASDEEKSSTEPKEESATGKEDEVEASKLSDTQPSKAVPVSQSSSDSEEVPPDEADTVHPGDGDLSFTPAPPPLGDTPITSPPAMDASGMPLPQRVPERDIDGTHVSGAVYSASTATENVSKTSSDKNFLARIRTLTNFARSGCLMRGFILAAFSFILIGVFGIAFALFQYSAIASSLPSVDDLRDRASQFETTRILDANGNLLYEILDPNAGRRTYVPLDEISPFMVAAIVATEDKEFYANPGFSPLAIIRAFYQNITSGEVVSGASTITQQLARILLLDPEEASSISYLRKVREAILAAEITRRYEKDEILELYLNEIYYGNLAYGVQAAAETYFGSSASELDLAQASMLAGLPQAPSVYDIYSNNEATLLRQQDVLRAMHELSNEQNCIFVSNDPEKVCVGLDLAAEAALFLLDYEFNTPDIQIRQPHWVHYIRSLLEEQYDPQTIYRSGFTVYTTLDPQLQAMAQETLSQQVAALADRNAGSGALVAVQPSNGAILAMVGSADFYNEDIDGQINMAVSPRQPGSSIKPLTYAAAFELGWTPATLLWDVESEFPPSGNPDDPREPYIPVNYDERHHGPITVRTALANSYNIPAVKVLDFVGIYDDPETDETEGLIAFAHRMGITDLNELDYGLSLTLGGGEVQLLDLTGAYATFANQGELVTPYAISRIVDHGGEVVFEAESVAAEQVIRPEHAFLISSILSDNQARIPSFGPNSILNLPFPAAAKTGTTNDFRDNWTMGFTPDLAVGVWVGNPDFTPMDGTSGLSGAAPIWAEFMQQAIDYLVDGQPQPFSQPNGIVETVICSISGAEPSERCSGERREFFAADQPPEPKEEDLWQDLLIDTWTGLRASPQCSEFTEKIFAMNVQDPWAIEWLTDTSTGRNWAEDRGFEEPIFFTPEEACDEDDSRPVVSIIIPDDGDSLTSSPLEIVAQVDSDQYFDRYVLEFAYGENPDPWDWEELRSRDNPVESPDKIYTWDLSDLKSGILSLRLILHSTTDTFAEHIILLDIQLPTPTPTPTPSPTATATFTATPTASQTLTPSDTPTETLVASETPTASETSTPSLTPTETEIPSSPTP
jgi:penicillin-binding protein 1C